MRLGRKVWGETARIQDHLRDNMETWYSENFLKYICAIIMKSQNVMGDGVQSGYLLLPTEASSTGTGAHPIELSFVLFCFLMM